MCDKCNLNCCYGAEPYEWNMDGTEMHFCYRCLACYCTICDADNEPSMSFCSGCEKLWCFQCGGDSGHGCGQCDSWFCPQCAEKRKCAGCSDTICGLEDCDYWSACKCKICREQFCESCLNSYFCTECNKEDNFCVQCDHDEYQTLCEECGSDLCFDCRLKGCRHNWNNSCQFCLGMIGPKLAECYDRLQELERTA
jgi:hypothetical protein